MEATLSFKGNVIVYLRERGIIIERTEQDGENHSIICHIPESQNEEVKILQEEMEKTLDVVMMHSGLFGMNVWIVEDKNLEE